MKDKIYNPEDKELRELERIATDCGQDKVLKMLSGFKQTIEERNFLCCYMNSAPCLVGFKCPFPADEEHCDKDPKMGHSQICWLEVAHRETFNRWKTYSPK